jgi:hypothetical protein
MQNMTLGTLPFICGPTPSQQFGVELSLPVQGLDAPDYRIVNYPIPGQDYARVSSAFYDARTITLVGRITGATPTGYLANRQLLSQATAIQRDQFGYPALTKLSFTMLDGNSYFIYVQAKKPVFDMTYLTWTKYQLTLLAPDARIYSTTQLSSGNITPLVSRGILVPTIVPVLGSGTTGGSATIFNPGTTDSHPLITFKGPLTNPYIQNATTGYSWQLDYTLLGGDSVVVDMYNKTVVFDGSTNFISYMDANSTWWTVVPGINGFTLSTGSTADTGSVSISCNPAYEGL